MAVSLPPLPEVPDFDQKRAFVIGVDGQPLMPCKFTRAQTHILKGKAVLIKAFPVTIRMLVTPATDIKQQVYLSLQEKQWLLTVNGALSQIPVWTEAGNVRLLPNRKRRLLPTFMNYFGIRQLLFWNIR